MNTTRVAQLAQKYGLDQAGLEYMIGLALRHTESGYVTILANDWRVRAHPEAAGQYQVGNAGGRWYSRSGDVYGAFEAALKESA
jgi:hypothetical protein